MVYNLKNLVSLLLGGEGRYFQRRVGVATFEIYWRPQKIDVNFRGSLLSEVYGNIDLSSFADAL